MYTMSMSFPALKNWLEGFRKSAEQPQAEQSTEEQAAVEQPAVEQPPKTATFPALRGYFDELRAEAKQAQIARVQEKVAIFSPLLRAGVQGMRNIGNRAGQAATGAVANMTPTTAIAGGIGAAGTGALAMNPDIPGRIGALAERMRQRPQGLPGQPAAPRVGQSRAVAQRDGLLDWFNRMQQQQ